jgi:carboxyl-terminal processing protease
VNGDSPIEYARREIEPFQSASTPQDRELRTFSYGFLQGGSATPVRLAIRGSDGSEKEYIVARSGYQDVRPAPAFAWRMLPRRFALVTLNSFESSDVAARFAEEFGKIREASAIILDLRWNGGGDSSAGYEVLRRLIDRPARTSRQAMRHYNPTDRARGTLLEWEEPSRDSTDLLSF